MFNHNPLSQKLKGGTLLEVLLALSISLMLFATILELYGSSKRHHQLQFHLHQLQDHVQTMTDLISNEIKRAGHIGCARLTKDFPIISHVTTTINQHNQLSGTDHHISVRYAAFPHDILVKPTSDSSTIYISDTVHYEPQEIIIISDCQKAEITQITKVGRKGPYQKIILSYPLTSSFKQGAEVAKLHINDYFIEASPEKNADTQILYTLYQKNIHQNKIAVVDHITQLTFLYAENGAIEKPAQQIQNWDHLSGVAIKVAFSIHQLNKQQYVYISRH